MVFNSKLGILYLVGFIILLAIWVLYMFEFINLGFGGFFMLVVITVAIVISFLKRGR